MAANDCSTPRSRTSTEASLFAATHSLFIREQGPEWLELRHEFRGEPEAINRLVWSPVSCRHTSWTYAARPYGMAA